MERIDISRAEFETRFGFKPEPNIMGMLFCTPSGVPVTEFTFTDDEVDYSAMEVAELERIWKLK